MMYIAAAVVLVAAALFCLRKKIMSLGLQIFNSNGNTVLDTNDLIYKVAGETDLNRSASRSVTSGTVTADLGEGTLWYIITYIYSGSAPGPGGGSGSYFLYLPKITQTSYGFRWEYESDFSEEWDYPLGVHIIYGAY